MTSGRNEGTAETEDAETEEKMKAAVISVTKEACGMKSVGRMRKENDWRDEELKQVCTIQRKF